MKNQRHDQPRKTITLGVRGPTYLSGKPDFFKFNISLDDLERIEQRIEQVTSWRRQDEDVCRVQYYDGGRGAFYFGSSEQEADSRLAPDTSLSHAILMDIGVWEDKEERAEYIGVSWSAFSWHYGLVSTDPLVEEERQQIARALQAATAAR